MVYYDKYHDDDDDVDDDWHYKMFNDNKYAVKRS